MKHCLTLFASLLIATALTPVFAQYKSWEGVSLSPHQPYRCLNIYIHIIFDVTQERNGSEQYWPSSDVEGLNTSIPKYTGKFFLPDTNGIKKAFGSITKRYYEASFGATTFFGDAICVSIKQSTVNPNGYFSYHSLIQKSVQLINKSGGVNGNTLGGYEHIEDFSFDGDKNFDIVNFMFRNTDLTAGNLNGGGMSGGFLRTGILIDGRKANANHHTLQVLGTVNMVDGNATVLDHELGHKFFGGNEFHTSGGNHWSTYSPSTFMGLQSGYGIMGVGRSSLVNTNGYERWRMHWTSPKYNPGAKAIQASNTKSDISKEDGKQTFYLRDFMTTGDAIRIKLPYKDSEYSSNQYLWIENHQIGRNGKENFYIFPTNNCNDYGIPGCFMYVQVGKDILESKNRAEVWPRNETDNLKMLNAEGNFDMQYVGRGTDCPGWDKNRKVFKNLRANPLSGQNDQTAIFDLSTVDKLTSKQENIVHIKQLENGEIAKGWPRLGENNDIFTNGSVLNLSTNPTPSNMVTSYVSQGGGQIRPYKTKKDNLTIYLTGLNIAIFEDKISNFGDSSHVMRVEINWKNYDVNSNVRYTGNIMVKEQLVIKKRKSILVDQSKVPTQPTRVTETGEFCHASIFTLDSATHMKLEKKAILELRDSSTLKLMPGSTLRLQKDAQIIVAKGSKITIEKGSQIKKHRKAQIIYQ